MFARLEEIDRRIWEGRSHVLEDATHALGGAGAGMLVYSAVARWARPIAYGLIGLSFLLHAYAFVSSQAKDETMPARDRIFSRRGIFSRALNR